MLAAARRRAVGEPTDRDDGAAAPLLREAKLLRGAHLQLRVPRACNEGAVGKV